MARYAEIVEMVAPDKAAAGSVVSVEVKIKNIWTSQVHIYCGAVLDSHTRFIDWQDAWVGPGQVQSFYGSFVMPGQVTINAYSYYEAMDGVYSDDWKSKVVKLIELAPGFSEFVIADYRTV